MGETDLHRDWMFRILELLRYRYRHQPVYVASNLLVYYDEGVPHHYVVPDDFVVLDCDPARRRTFKTWEEGRAPDVVFEVTSLSSRRDDEAHKPKIYDQMGVKEYFLYDPTSDYLRPPLKGFRRSSAGFVAISPNHDQTLTCQTLGIELKLAGGALVLIDAETRETLLTGEEAERAGREAERAAREAAERQVAELTAELDTLRKRVEDQSIE
jgi:Uma2 family endonuclease